MHLPASAQRQRDLATPTVCAYKPRGPSGRPFSAGTASRQYQHGGLRETLSEPSGAEDTAVRVLESSFAEPDGVRPLLREEAAEREEGRALFALQTLDAQLLHEGNSLAVAHAKLAEVFSLSVSGVAKALARGREQAALSESELLQRRLRKPSGRPLALREADCAAAIEAACKKPWRAAHAAHAELKRQGVKVSVRTVRNYLKDAAFKGRPELCYHAMSAKARPYVLFAGARTDTAHLEQLMEIHRCYIASVRHWLGKKDSAGWSARTEAALLVG
jgi:transposase